MKRILAILLITIPFLFPTTHSFAASFQGVNYAVIEQSNFENIKNSIVIRLEKKVSKAFLEKLALKLRKAEPKKYDRMFITYYLPGMTPGSGAWAASHFNPNLKVNIFGTTIAEEKALMSKPKNPSGKVLVNGLTNRPMLVRDTHSSKETVKP